MKFYLITYNDTQELDPQVFHDIIKSTATIDDWWHYLPNTYIVQTNSSSKYLADTIIARCNGLSFLIMKVDMNDFNGVLNKDAWEWIDRKIKGSLTLKIKPGTLPPVTPLYPGKVYSGNKLLFDLFNPPLPNKPVDLSTLLRSSGPKLNPTPKPSINLDDILKKSKEI